MARPLREEAEGAVHHVFARRSGRQVLFVDDRDRRLYLKLVGFVVCRKNWRCLAYCLMDNHMHLLIETPDANLADGMQLLHGTYGRDFNKRYRRDGHVFQGRYGSVTVRDDSQLWTVAAYIAANPVEAGLCRKPEHWPWNSHLGVLDGTAPAWLDVDRLLSYFSVAGGDPSLRYREMVTDRLLRGQTPQQT